MAVLISPNAAFLGLKLSYVDKLMVFCSYPLLQLEKELLREEISPRKTF